MSLERVGEMLRDRWRRPRPPRDPQIHLREALAWIYRAQDAGSDRGVSHSYLLGKGWMRSYPETTGYIIPTLYNWAGQDGNGEARRRAGEMADWELTVQLPEGGVPSLATGEPVVFDTGQVLFGWLAAFRETGDPRYKDAVLRAGEWLLSVMDADGTWNRHGGAGAGPLTYNVRAAWALLEAGRGVDCERFQERARAKLTWSLGQETAPGWFERNCLNDPVRPLLHTIAYTAQGQLEAGLLLQEERLIEAARRTARALADRVEASGRMAGRFDRAWRPAASWACLTGMAQTVIVWRRLEEAVGETQHRDATARATRFLLSVHDLESPTEGLRGGVRGSFPVDGAYCRWRLPNWAAKFFIDALLPAGALTRHPG